MKIKQPLVQLMATFTMKQVMMMKGKWTEIKYFSSSKIFKLQEPGTYYVQLFQQQDEIAPARGTIRIGLRSGILLSRYFIIGFFVYV